MIHHETMKVHGNPNMNIFYKVTSGSYKNATRNATVLLSVETYRGITTILLISYYQKYYHLATIK